jgi:hypothetical protein
MLGMVPCVIRRWSVRAVLMIGSLALSLLFAELAATLAAKGAYPYLNLFVADPQLGVVLEANATTRVKSKLGRVTRIDTDEHGRRVHPTGDGPTVLLLGDSQAFGYLVEAEDAVAAQLGRINGAHVIDAAVPSYGPHEYVAIAEQLVPELRPDYVVFVANLANDWWEANVDNSRRSTARDGWLVSRSAEPRVPLGQSPHTDRRSAFPLFASLGGPLSRFLFGRSHLLLAVRRVAAHVTSTFDAATPQRLLRDLPQLDEPRGGHRSRITPFLLSANRIAEAHGAKLIAVALPIDVLVSASEWPKYGTAPIELAATGVLLDDFIDDATDHGIRTVDLRAHLADQPGVFLDDDPHLSPLGHERFARALASHMSPELAGADR